MKKLDKHLLNSFLGPFVMTFSIVLFILMMQFLWLYIDELVGKGLSLGVILEFMMWGSATLIPQTLPLATLLASIMTLGGLGEHNELLAMKAAGISLSRVLRPLIFVAIGISIGAFFVSNNLIPISYQKIYALRDDIGRKKEEIKIPTGIFYDGIEGYILKVESHDDETGIMHDIMVYDHTQGKGNVSLTVADSGSIRLTPDKANIIFTLYNGRTYEENNNIRHRDTTLEQNIINFESQRLLVSLDNYSFERSDDARFGDEIMSKNLSQLTHDRDSIQQEYLAGTRPQCAHRYTFSNALRYMHQLDTNIGLGRNLSENMNFKELKDTVFTTDQARDLEITANALKSLETQDYGLIDFERSTYRYVSPIRKMQIERFRKFTLSLACLLFFFIGAPLGSIIRKGGLGTPVIISMLFFVFYWVIDMSGKKLARDGAISPFEGTFISSAILLPIGIFITRRAITDSSIFNWTAYWQYFKKYCNAALRYVAKKLRWFKRNHGVTKVVYMGTPEFAVEPLKALIAAEYEISAVVTVPDKQSGRGLKVNESAVKKFAVEKGLKVLQPVSLKDPAFLDELRAIGADLFVVVAFRMLPKEVWNLPRLGTFNLHASLLPQYRGAAPINWAIIRGERQTGVTTFLIDEQIDTGSILHSQACAIEPFDNAGTLHDKLMTIGADLVVKTARDLVRRKAKPQPQEVYGEIKPAPKITKELCHIDWNYDASVLSDLVRGLSPYPAAFSILTDGSSETIVKIYEAYADNDTDYGTEMTPGKIHTDGRSWLAVECSHGSLRILSLQVAGKKRLDIAEFLKGFRDSEKYRFI